MTRTDILAGDGTDVTVSPTTGGATDDAGEAGFDVSLDVTNPDDFEDNIDVAVGSKRRRTPVRTARSM
ncbi:MAG: hypothetical protein U5K38_17185 [Woeseiaceae bacterium]|nr:hypothetical protein [Woeseiaceae bacterium]